MSVNKRDIWVSLFVVIFVAATSVLIYKLYRTSKEYNQTVLTRAAADPGLLIFEKTENKCLIQVRRMSGIQPSLWFEAPDCPCETADCSYRAENVIFDPANQRVLLLRDGQYWTVENKLGSSLKPLVSAFKVPIEGDLDFSKTWIDRKSEALRVAYVVVPPYDLEDNPQGDKWRKKFPILKDSWVSGHDPGVGVPAVAIVAEAGRNGKWKILASQLTTTGAGESLGLGAVQKYMTETDSYSLNDLFLRSTCSAQDCDLEQLKQTPEVNAWLKHIYGDKLSFQEGDGVGYIPTSDNDGFIFAVNMGDSPHAGPPIYYCKESCVNALPIPAPKSPAGLEQTSLAPNAGYMLVSSEYYGTDAKVYKVGSIDPVLSFGPETRVLWLPPELLDLR